MANSSNSSNIARETLKVKETFPSLQNKKIEIVHKVISGNKKPKLIINMTTKELSQKQVIIPMNINSANSFIKNLSTHVININRALKNIKLNIIVDFICVDNKGIVITTNNIASPLDLQAIEKYIKSIVYIEAKYVESPRLPQSKLYLKIIGILYLSKHTNSCITSNNIEKILKSNHIFNNIVLVLKSRIIKLSPKLDMSIIWINIWNTQSRFKTKYLINRRFNVESFIATIQGTNINPGIPQCKNCWK